jgi:hypothetical protein
MGDQLGAKDFTNKSLQVGSNCVHAVSQVIGKRLSEFDQFDDSLSPLFNLDSVRVFHVHTHGDLGSVDDLLGFLFVDHDSGDVVLDFVADCVALSVEEVDEAGVDLVVIDDFGHLGEVPGVPLLQPHAEGVDVFIHLLDEGDGLRDGLVTAGDVLSNLAAGELMTETELGAFDIFLIDL